MSDVVMCGPLGDIARQAGLQDGIHTEDVYAAALCWWAAAVAPSAVLPVGHMEWPCLVWGAFLTDDARPPLVTALAAAGMDSSRFRRLTSHHDITTTDRLRAAWRRSARSTRPGTGFSLLLTGSPVKHRPSRTFSDDSLAYALRTAWDGNEYRNLEHQRRSRAGGPAGEAPRIGVLWEMPAGDWRYRAQTEAASSSRFLVFRRKTVIPGATLPGRRIVPVASQAVEGLARIYDSLSHQQVQFTMTGEAAAKFWPVQLSAARFDDQESLPEDQFVRLDAHTHRIAAALALAEDTDVITGGHIEAAWSLVARSGRDRARLLCPDALDLVGGILDEIGGQVRTATGSPQALPLGELFPPGGPHAVSAPAAVPASGVRDRKGRVRRDGAVVQDVKDWYGNQCQMCGSVLGIPGPRQTISEGAHIRPLSQGGPDYTGNVLCLCPNCHTQFDQGGLYLTDDLRVVETVTGTVRQRLETEPGRDVGLEYVRWHRARWAQYIQPVRQTRGGR
ncbi:HNH endonuclease [Kitasatospora sp. NPDC127121]|uniref:HNH endonuclease n=1 Tax=Kitasatospora sp. NPDC127121 TaxID=3345371 RepID=UPI00363CBF7E